MIKGSFFKPEFFSFLVNGEDLPTENAQNFILESKGKE